MKKYEANQCCEVESSKEIPELMRSANTMDAYTCSTAFSDQERSVMNEEAPA